MLALAVARSSQHTYTVDGEGPERHEEAAAHLIQLVALGVLHVGHLDVEAARYVM